LLWSHCILAGIGTRERVLDFCSKGLPVPYLDVMTQAAPRGRRGDFAMGRSDNPAGRGPGRLSGNQCGSFAADPLQVQQSVSTDRNENLCTSAAGEASVGGSLA
jgi:hypothetical protein